MSIACLYPMPAQGGDSHRDSAEEDDAVDGKDISKDISKDIKAAACPSSDAAAGDVGAAFDERSKP
jgi:hypothetical protein